MANEQEFEPSGQARPHEKKGRARRAAKAVFEAGRDVSYITGVQTQQWLRFFGQRLLRPIRAVGRVAYKVADFLVLRHVRAIGREARRFGSGFAVARERVRAARERGLWLAVLQTLMLPFLALRRHRRALACIGNLLMPVAAAIVLVFTVQYWSGLSFGLALEYDGESFGCIADESVFDTAAAMVNARVCETDSNETLAVRTPKMTLTVVSNSDVLSESAVCDKIIRTSGDQFAEATGLYIDGELVGAMTSSEELANLLDARLAEQRADNRTAEFVQTIKEQDGLYPLSTVVTEEGMDALLNVEKAAAQYYTVQVGDTISQIAAAHDMTVSELQELNELDNVERITAGQQLQLRSSVKRLQVRTTEVSGAEEVVKHNTLTEYDSSAYEGTRKVKVTGSDGSRYVTTKTVAVDGVVQSVTEISSETIKEAVDEVIVIGTKKQAAKSVYTSGVTIQDGDGVATGSMQWPVPAVHNTSQGYHGGHLALDIANGPVSMMNQVVVAADGGTVKEVNTVNTGTGYGIYVVIDHGNGLTTLYAHLNSVSVVKGQPVTRGQQIGRAGSTGRSTGPHLHFEVRQDGRKMNPWNYVSR